MTVISAEKRREKRNGGGGGKVEEEAQFIFCSGQSRHHRLNRKNPEARENKHRSSEQGQRQGDASGQ